MGGAFATRTDRPETAREPDRAQLNPGLAFDRNAALTCR